jgi:hypothetical protein
MFDTLKRFWKKSPFGGEKALFTARGKITAEPYKPPVIPIPQSTRWMIMFLPHQNGRHLFLTHEAAFKEGEIIQETGPKIRLGRFLWTTKVPFACNFSMERDAQRFVKEFIVANEFGAVVIVPVQSQKSNIEGQPNGEDPGESPHEKVNSGFENKALCANYEEDPEKCANCKQIGCKFSYPTD